MEKYRGLSELWKLSEKAYEEIMFQSVLLLKTSGIFPQEEEAKNIKNIFKKSPRGSYKIILIFFIIFMNTFSIFMAKILDFEIGNMASIYYVSTMLTIMMYVFAFQVMDEISFFVSSRISELLITLPLSHSDVSKILLMCFLRILDTPLIIATLLVPLTYGISFNSILGAIIILIGTLVTEIFALSLGFFITSYFYFKVATQGEIMMWKWIVRFFYMAVWLSPFFLSYPLMSIVSEISMSAKSRDYPFLSLFYPFSFGFLALCTTSCNPNNLPLLGSSIFASSAYIFTSVLLLKWLISRVSNIWELRVPFRASFKRIRDISIKIRDPWLGIIKKDLKLILRSHSASNMILLMPFGTSILVALMISTFSSLEQYLPFFLILILLYMNMILIILTMPLSLIGLEDKAYSYVVSLPMKKRTLLFSKTFLSFVLYLVLILILLPIILITAPKYTSVMMDSGIFNILAVFSALTFICKLCVEESSEKRFLVPTVSKAFTMLTLSIVSGLLPILIPVISNHILTIMFSDFVGKMGFWFSSIVEFTIAIMVLNKTD